MEIIKEFFSRLRELESLLTWGGYPVLMFIIFAETGLLIGFFLPGDSLLVTAGVLVNAGLINPFELSPFVNLLLMNVVLMVMAIVGDAVGYSIGRRAGPALFKRKKSFFFRPKHLIATQAFYDKHGGKTIILARFMPFARTFAPVVAGIAQMPYRRFAMFNIAGGVGWIFSMTFIGYFLGKVFNAKQIEKVIYLIIFISVAPVIYGAVKNWLKTRNDPPEVELDEEQKAEAERVAAEEAAAKAEKAAKKAEAERVAAEEAAAKAEKAAEAAKAAEGENPSA